MQSIVGTLASGATAPAPHIECLLPEGPGEGIGLIILPGGGYAHLAEHEGRGYAEHFRDAGLACFVVSYRLGSQGFHHPAMLEDALAAVATVRSRASEFGIDPARVGIMGSSAGGHLAAHALVAWREYECDVSLRPDFGVLCYPVITTSGPHAHPGCMQNLLGDLIGPALLDSVSCEKRVCEETPPTFLWHTREDTGVPLENSLLFAAALRAHGVPFELHVYGEGGHGLGLATPFDWAADCLRWIKATV